MYWSFCVQCLFKATSTDAPPYFAGTPPLNPKFTPIFLCPAPSAIFQQNINFLIYTTTSIASICLCNSLLLLKIIEIFETLSSTIERFNRSSREHSTRLKINCNQNLRQLFKSNIIRINISTIDSMTTTLTANYKTIDTTTAVRIWTDAERFTFNGRSKFLNKSEKKTSTRWTRR